MSTDVDTSLSNDDWTTIRDFRESESGYTLPKYEAKFVDDVSKKHLEDELVLVKETNPLGGERMYHIPREVLSGLQDRLA